MVLLLLQVDYKLKLSQDELIKEVKVSVLWLA